MNACAHLVEHRLRRRIVRRDVGAEHRRRRLAVAREQRAGHRDADAAADVAHQVEQARRVAHLLARNRDPSTTVVSGTNSSDMPTPWNSCGQKMSQ